MKQYFDKPSLEERIRTSEKFPRIRDAEKKLTPDVIPKIKSKSNENLPADADGDSQSIHCFSKITVNEDGSKSKYLPFDDVYYPKIGLSVQTNHRSLENLWMGGFIHEAGLETDKIKSSLQIDNLSDLDHLSDKSQNSRKHLFKSGSSESRISNTKLPPISIKTGRQFSDKSISTLSKFSSLGDLLDGDEYFSSLFEKIKGEKPIPKSNNMSIFSSISNTNPNNNQRPKRTNKKSRASFNPKPKPYIDQLEEINKYQKSKYYKPPILEPLSCPRLDALFDLQLRENEASKIIQKAWRRTRILLPWRRAVYSVLAIVRIQKFIRGAFTRKKVAQYYRFLYRLGLLFQSLSRKYLSNLHLRPVLKIERQSAILIQSTIRGWLGRKKWVLTRKILSATRIQALWRGITHRSKGDVRWLDSVVIPIQRVARGMLSRKKFKLLKRELNSNASLLQSTFRTFMSRKKLGIRLQERENAYRMDCIAILSSEEATITDTLDRLKKRFVKNNYKPKIEAAITSYFDKLIQVHQVQNDYVELVRQSEVISPRGIKLGYGPELKKNCKEYRDKLTSDKLSLLFNETIGLFEREEVLEAKVSELEKLSDHLDKLMAWKDMEYRERRERSYWRNLRQARKDHKLAVADEKRKWRVLFYTLNGKPDKKRPPGKAWDSSVFAGPEKQTYSGAGADLFAFIPKPEESTSTKDNVNKALNQYTLQNFLDQNKQYEKLMMPLENIMSGFLMASGANKKAETNTEEFIGSENQLIPVRSVDVGFGPMGKDIASALKGIGVSSPSLPLLSPIRNRPHPPPQTLPIPQKDVPSQGIEIESYNLSETSPAKGNSSIREKKNHSSSPSDISSLALIPKDHPSKTEGRSLNEIDFNDDDTSNKSLLSSSSTLSSSQRWEIKRKRRHPPLAPRLSAVLSKYDDLVSESDQRRQLRDARLSQEIHQSNQGEIQLDKKQRDQERREKRKERRGDRATAIPWDLLDQLDGERQRFENEKSFVEFNLKF